MNEIRVFREFTHTIYMYIIIDIILLEKWFNILTVKTLKRNYLEAMVIISA